MQPRLADHSNESRVGRHSLLIELENAMKSRDAQERATALDRITDLFFSTAVDAEGLFDEVSMEARRRIYEEFEQGRLDESVLAEFARANFFAETAASLAILTAMPIKTVVDQMIGRQISGLLVICRSKNYSWRTAKAIICVRHERTTADIELARNEYYALSVEAAARALRFIGARRALMRDSIEE